MALLVGIATTRLVIFGPEDLKSEFELQDYKIEASYGNFGNIPYGKTFIGRIYYNESNPTGCKKGNFTADFSGDPDDVLTPIFLVDRSDCTFVTKVRNIEKAGGSLAVIINDEKKGDITDIVMSDDGTGTGINIPSMIISYEDGKKLKDFL
jgi:hypothetical protein